MKKLTLIAILVAAALTATAGFAQRGFLPGNGPARAGEYIVVFTPGTPAAEHAAALAPGLGAEVGATWTVINGALFRGINENAARGLAHNPNVLYVEPNTLFEPVQFGIASFGVSQNNPLNWGLDRIDQAGLPLNNKFTVDADGTGVHAYVIDTGIQTTHNEFKRANGSSRVILELNASGDGGTAADCAGHGTAMASVIGGVNFGVAKNIDLHSIRVLDCNTFDITASSLVTALNHVKVNGIRPAVVNMSLSGPQTQSVDDAVNSTVTAGVFVSVAAGNEAINACQTSPAAATLAYVTAASTVSDAFASSYSNFGTCVDILAPGDGITAAWSGANNEQITDSGTSYSTAFTTGAAALFLDQNGALTPANIVTTLTSRATSGVISGLPLGTPNKLLNVKGVCPPLFTKYTGTATANGQHLVSASFTGGGHFEAVLTCDNGPNVADLDLYLDTLYCGFGCFFDWIARSAGATCSENLIFDDAPGTYTYRWRVHAYSGISSGELVPLTLCANKPLL